MKSTNTAPQSDRFSDKPDAGLFYNGKGRRLLLAVYGYLELFHQISEHIRMCNPGCSWIVQLAFHAQRLEMHRQFYSVVREMGGLCGALRLPVPNRKNIDWRGSRSGEGHRRELPDPGYQAFPLIQELLVAGWGEGVMSVIIVRNLILHFRKIEGRLRHKSQDAAQSSGFSGDGVETVRVGHFRMKPQPQAAKPAGGSTATSNPPFIRRHSALLLRTTWSALAASSWEALTGGLIFSPMASGIKRLLIETTEISDSRQRARKSGFFLSPFIQPPPWIKNSSGVGWSDGA